MINTTLKGSQLPFRIGTSSYIIPDDILPNVHWLADKVSDVELVLFDVDQYCNLPDPKQILELRKLAETFGLSYTVHLPLDLSFSERTDDDASIKKALQVMRITHDLDPWAYVCHLDCSKTLGKRDENEIAAWQNNCMDAVDRLMHSFPAQDRLAIENLESYPMEWNRPVIDNCQVSCCLDIGHLWLQKRNVMACLLEWLPITRVIHLHGIGTRDHQSLTHMPVTEVRQLMQYLLKENYQGVVTLEVFNQKDFESSMDVLEKCL